jgi:hypothetical protein
VQESATFPVLIDLALLPKNDGAKSLLESLKLFNNRVFGEEMKRQTAL